MRVDRSRRGFVMVTMLCGMVALLALVGLAVDVGYEEYLKTCMQTAADAAAVGGVQELRASGGTNLVAAAKADASANGFTDGGRSVTVTVNNPPSTGYYTADNGAVEVTISQSVPTFFMSVVGIATGTVQARAVARLGSSPNCFYALSPTGSGAFSASGGVTVQISCGAVINSSNSSALSVSGGSHVTASSISVVGGASISGGSVVSPNPVLGSSASSDPFAALPSLTRGSCDHTNFGVSGGATTTVSEGTYCGGISISGGSRVTFNSGTYFLVGGGLSVSGGSSISGSGLLFYNTRAAGYGYGAISLSGGCSINLSARTTGTYAGILFFQDRAVASGTGSSFSGGSSSTLAGALYFPTTSVSYSGGSSAAYTIVVANTVSFSGGSTLNNDYSSLPGGSPIRGSTTLSE
jgi:hypothetical protein